MGWEEGGRELIEPEKDPASKFIESSHDFRSEQKRRKIRGLFEGARVQGTTFHIDRVPFSLPLPLSLSRSGE